MLNKVSVGALLRAVIGMLGAAVIVMLLLEAWTSWRQYRTAARSETVVEISRDLFAALHNLRVDRSTTLRDLTGERQLDALPKHTQDVRVAEMAALKPAMAALAAFDFPGKPSVFPPAEQAVKKLMALHEESARAVTLPKASRRPDLAREFNEEVLRLLQLLDKLSDQLTLTVKLDDAFIDQLLILKQLAWIARNSAGDAQVMVSNGMVGQKLPPDALLIYTANLGKTDSVWQALEQAAGGLTLPATFSEALQAARREFFDPKFSQLRLKVFKSVLAGEKTDIKVEEWTQMSVARLGFLLRVAEAALDAAREHAASKASASLRHLAINVGLLVFALAFVAATILLVARRVSAPLRAIQGAMLKLADGDFAVTLPGLDRRDEIGDVANAVERFKVLALEKARAEADETLSRQKAEADMQARAAEERARAADEQARAMRALGEGLSRLAEGDLRFRLTEDFAASYQGIRNDFNNAMTRLEETVQAIAAANGEIANAATEIAAATTDLSQRTEEQAASLEETTASMEEISATVKKNAENAQHANALTQGTRETADQGGKVVADAVSAMARIEQSSHRISDIIAVIDEISRQTNLLALNAAVEAARAGEAGRGFAVVAAEVRSLAQRSSQAAKDIKDLIVSSSAQVEEGVGLVNRAGASLNAIVESIRQVADIVANIAHASTEQAAGLEQIGKALGQLDEVTQQNSALVEQNAATAKTLERQQGEMRERMTFFSFGDALAAVPQPARAERVAAVKPAQAHAAPPAKQPVRKPVMPPRARGNTALAEDRAWEEF